MRLIGTCAALQHSFAKGCHRDVLQARCSAGLTAYHALHHIVPCCVMSKYIPPHVNPSHTYHIVHITSRYITACCSTTCCLFTKAFSVDDILLCRNRGAARGQTCGFDWKHRPCKIYQTMLIDSDSSFWTCHIDNSFLCLMLHCSCCSLRSQCNCRQDRRGAGRQACGLVWGC